MAAGLILEVHCPRIHNQYNFWQYSICNRNILTRHRQSFFWNFQDFFWKEECMKLAVYTAYSSYTMCHKERSRAVLKLKVSSTKKYRQIWTQCTSMWCSRFMMEPYALRTFQQTSSSIRKYTVVHFNEI